MTTEDIVNNSLNLSGLACPMPIIRLKKYLAHNSSHLEPFNLIVTDSGALKDIPVFCQQQNLTCELIHCKNDEHDDIQFLIYA